MTDTDFSYTDAWNDAKRIDEEIDSLFWSTGEAELDLELLARLNTLVIASDSVVRWLKRRILEEKKK